VGALLVLLGITVLTAWLWQRAPFLSVGWLWFLITLLPVIGLVQVGWQAMADRYTYIPCIGIFIMLIWGTQALLERWKPVQTEARSAQVTRSLAASFAGLSILASVLLTRHQLAYWKDSETLFRHTLAITEKNAFTHNILGLTLRLQGRLDE